MRSFLHSLRRGGKTTKQNLRNCLKYGWLFGLLQGVVIATIRLLIGRWARSKVAVYVSLMLHPVISILCVSGLTLAIVVKKAKALWARTTQNTD